MASIGAYAGDTYFKKTGGALTGNLTAPTIFPTNVKIINSGASGGNWVIDSSDDRFRFYNDVTGFGFELAGNTIRDVGGSNSKYLKESDNVTMAGLTVTGNVSIGSSGSLTRILSFGLEDNKPLIINSTYLGTAEHISFGSGDLRVNRGPGFRPVLLEGEATQIVDTVTSAPVPTGTGTKGQVIITGGYRYECISVNTWVRSAVETTW
ncbi:hypothetical protein G7074_15855 [Pedobacter sp. HDW13]|uniref:hypothetical protein n=1 Tax=Pedobacter sp. HDW13 TaxID=2714940 RepID=UPI00140DA943|nr:hypothetical protein [Pedobacter sp. HDW13]QIL40611.1 hypothetical protein G7074_15855 [Pedobacter sp. HDW13]